MNCTSYFFCLICIFCFKPSSYAWGPTGHRVVGEVAEKHMKKRTLRKIRKLLKGQSIASSSTYGDDIKSDSKYRGFYSWHYVNFPLDSLYDPENRDPKGDVIFAIGECQRIIKDPKTSIEGKAFYLRLLIHFVGDIHMPLHVGRAEDLGGNRIKLKWFREDSNLHRVWDEDMINHYGMSYTELSNDLPPLSKADIKNIQDKSVIDWANESRALAIQVYDSASEGDELWYPYQYEYFGSVKEQLNKAGIRLAELLDDLMKEVKL